MIDVLVRNFSRSERFFRYLGLKGVPRAVKEDDVAGYSKTIGPYGEIVNADLVQCCHCRYTWEYVAGSGRFRGWCSRCNQITCGNPDCMVCVPFVQRLENVEAGRPILTPSAPRIVVPDMIPRADPLLPARR